MIAETAIPVKSSEGLIVAISFIFNKLAPRIVGIAKINENLAACSLSTPEKIKLEIVNPERENPGITARPWKIPQRKVFFGFRFPLGSYIDAM